MHRTLASLLLLSCGGRELAATDVSPTDASTIDAGSLAGGPADATQDVAVIADAAPVLDVRCSPNASKARPQACSGAKNGQPDAVFACEYAGFTCQCDFRGDCGGANPGPNPSYEWTCTDKVKTSKCPTYAPSEGAACSAPGTICSYPSRCCDLTVACTAQGAWQASPADCSPRP